MADLGEFGRERALASGEIGEPDHFRWYGERFEVPAGISALVPMGFVHDIKLAQAHGDAARGRKDRAQRDVDVAATADERAAALVAVTAAEVDAVNANVDAMAAMNRYILECIGEDQWDRFRRVTVAHAVDEDELMTLCARIVEAIAARPTRRSSGSPGGPSSTGDGSTVDSGSPGGPRLVQRAPETPPWGDEPEPGRQVLGEVIELTEAQRQQMEIRRASVPVSELLGLRSGG